MCYFSSTDMFQGPFLFLLFFIFFIPLLFVFWFFPSNISFIFILVVIYYSPLTLESIFYVFREKMWNVCPSLNTHTHKHRHAQIHCSSTGALFCLTEYWFFLLWFFFPTQLPVQKSMFCYTDWSDSNVGDTSPTAWCPKNYSSKISLC